MVTARKFKELGVSKDDIDILATIDKTPRIAIKEDVAIADKTLV